MANQEMIQFLAQFGPMLGELAARVEFLELRLERLEGGGAAAAPAPGGAPTNEEAEGSFEFFGQKFDMKEMFERGMPAGGMSGLMDKIKNWKPGQPPPAAPPAPAAPDAPAPGTPTKP